MDLRQLAETALRRKLHHLVLHLAPPDDGGLPLARYRALATEVGALSWLDLNGGDPFARSDLPALAGAFSAELVTVLTPVHRVADVVAGAQALRAALPGELTVGLCLDGMRATHERRHGPDSWDRAWAAFDLLREVDGLRLELRTSVHADNVDELVALAQYAAAQGPDNHVVSLAAGGGGADAPSVAALDRVQAPLFGILDRYARDGDGLLARMRRNFQRMRWDVGVRTLRENRQIVPCLAGLSHAVVRADGAVAACDLLPALGSVAETSWQDLWRSKAADAQRDYIGAGSCHCTDDCALHDSIALRPGSIPHLLAK